MSGRIAFGAAAIAVTLAAAGVGRQFSAGACDAELAPLAAWAPDRTLELKRRFGRAEGTLAEADHDAYVDAVERYLAALRVEKRRACALDMRARGDRLECVESRPIGDLS